MLEKLDFILRYWNLRARYGALGEPLSPAERIELLSLIRLMATDHPLPEPGPAARGDDVIPLQLTAHHGFVAGELRMVCAGGIVVACNAPLRPGQSTIVRLADDASGTEYTLPCVVEWGFAGTPSAMALRVDGAPARRTVPLDELGAWPAPLGWSERRAAPTNK